MLKVPVFLLANVLGTVTLLSIYDSFCDSFDGDPRRVLGVVEAGGARRDEVA